MESPRRCNKHTGRYCPSNYRVLTLSTRERPYAPVNFTCIKPESAHMRPGRWPHIYTSITPAQRLQLTENLLLRNTDSPNFAVINEE